MKKLTNVKLVFGIIKINLLNKRQLTVKSDVIDCLLFLLNLCNFISRINRNSVSHSSAINLVNFKKMFLLILSKRTKKLQTSK